MTSFRTFERLFEEPIAPFLLWSYSVELWSCSDTVKSQTLLAATKQRLSSRFVPRLHFHKQFHTCSQMTGSSSKTNSKPGAAAKTPSHVQFIPLRFSRSGFFILFSLLVCFFFSLFYFISQVSTGWALPQFCQSRLPVRTRRGAELSNAPTVSLC